MNLLDYGRRLIIAKSGGEVVASDLADRLREPAVGEAQLLEAFEKQGADAADLDAVAGAARLLESVGATVDPGDFSRADPQPIAKSLHLRTPEERERIAKEARETNERIQRHANKAEAERAGKERRASETLTDKTRRLNEVTKSIERLNDARALERIDAAAARLRKADLSLTKSQAVVKACQDDPALYAAYQRHQFRQMGAIDDSPETLKKADDAQAILEDAARPYLLADPGLSHSQAVAKALEADPSLYTRTSPW